jgi:hypothetical protein
VTDRQEGDERIIARAERLKPWLRNLGAGLLGALVVGALVIGVQVLQNQSAHVRDCEEIETVKTGLRATMEEAERFGKSSPVRSQAQREAIATFYRDALNRLKPRHC